MSKTKKIITIALSATAGLLVVGALTGGYMLKGAIKVINRDKLFLMNSIEGSFSNQRLGPPEVLKIVPILESQYGKLRKISRVDGIPVIGDVFKAGDEFSFQVSADFEKGPVTFEARVSNEQESPKLIAISYKEGHFPRKRVRTAIAGALK